MHYLIIAVLAFALSVLGCEGKTGPAGPTGPSGAAGPAGPAGPQGSTGPAGPAGPQGPAGADGADGAQGPAGPAGPKGDKGDQGDPGDASTIDPSDLGNLLADVHHIALIQDGDAKDGSLVFNGPDFNEGTPGKNWDVALDLGESTEIVAKAATQTKDPILGVQFSWASKDDDVASVDNGMIEGLRAGESEITVTAEGRGIAVKFTVTVHSEVKSVVMTSPADGFFLSNGESVGLEATARDAAQDDKKNGIEGVDVPVDLTFMSSDDSVVSIDGAKATAEGVGTAKITAHYGDIASKAIAINVTPGGDVTHKITYTRISTDDRAFHIAKSHDYDGSAGNIAVYGPDDPRPTDILLSGGNGGSDVTYTVQIRLIDSEGNANVDNTATADNLTFTVQGVSIHVNGIADTVTGGIATITVYNDDGNGGYVSGTEDLRAATTTNAVVKAGVSRIILSYPGAEDVALPAITVTETVEEAPDTN